MWRESYFCMFLFIIHCNVHIFGLDVKPSVSVCVYIFMIQHFVCVSA